jgi:16S rRNA (adenine1518-N6/adenine1519-N6)-dimethyltransferase
MRSEKPKLGQNFLISPAAQMQIVEALGDIGQEKVVEIGPGKGAITTLLLPRAGRLLCIELDRALAAAAQARWGTAPNLTIVNASVLDADLAQLVWPGDPGHTAGKLVVVGNLPYYITSDILLHLFAQAETIDRAILMVQEEVAGRLAARPGTRDYGVLSATAQLHAKIEKLFTVGPDAFDPPPNVNSAVVRLTMRPRFEELGVPREPFLRFTQRIFQQKRKTMANNLKAAGFASDAIQKALAEARLAPAVRPEEVPLEQAAQLYNALERFAHWGVHAAE